jgi:hypothetical protein
LIAAILTPADNPLIRIQFENGIGDRRKLQKAVPRKPLEMLNEPLDLRLAHERRRRTR